MKNTQNVCYNNIKIRIKREHKKCNHVIYNNNNKEYNKCSQKA